MARDLGSSLGSLRGLIGNGTYWISGNIDGHYQPGDFSLNSANIFLGAAVTLTSTEHGMDWGIKKKVDPLDIHYPHQCFKCKRPLHFKELLNRNAFANGYQYSVKKWYNYETYKELKKQWRSKYVQFYCCFCYDKEFPSPK